LGKLIEKLIERLDPAIPSIIASHAAVRGAKLGAERSLSLGTEMTLSLNTLIDDKIDYVALGISIWRRSERGFSSSSDISGSIERVNFGEAGTTSSSLSPKSIEDPPLLSGAD